MTPVENLISRLEVVKGRNGAWTARCPAHADKSPSLAVREGEDGRVLLHCFGGCSTADVLGSIGMDMSDLFPADDKRREVTSKPSMKPAFFASDLMRIIHFEALIVQIVAFDIANGKIPNQETRERMLTAYQRIDEAVRYANV
jgi:hypothetical protein